MGFQDASRKLEPDGAWFACHTEDGPGTLRVRYRHGGWQVQAWGPGGERLAALAPAICGEQDSLAGFDPALHPRLRRLWSKHRTLRLGHAPSIFGALLMVVLQQRVSWRDATRSKRLMNEALGDDAPGPEPLRLPPSPERLAQLPSYAFHQFGIERKRAETIRRIASLGHRFERLRDRPFRHTFDELTSISGVGPWTASMVLGLALGDADALPLGDYALPHTISWFFQGKARSDDRAMLETLEPYRPHRFRVVRLLWATGHAAPRFGPRRPLRPIPTLL